MLKTIFVAVIGGLILFFVQNELKDVPTATYSVSDAIEIASPKGASEFAQEIVVNNFGQTPVKNISVKVPKSITTFKLTKHSNQIGERVFKEADRFELVYPELPPKQQFRLLARYDGSPMTKDWISISHDDGNAKVQDTQNSSINYFSIWLAFFLGVLVSSINDIRRWKRESYSKWAKSEDVYINKRPWYAFPSEWPEMQFEAIKRHLTEGSEFSFSKVEQSSYYQLLNRSKPTLLTDEQWSRLQSQAIELLMARFSREVTKYANTEKLIDLLKLKKPEGLPYEKWIDFEKSLKERLGEKLLPANMRSDDYIDILNSNNVTLKRLPEEFANEIRDRARSFYSEYLTSRNCIYREKSPYDVIKKARLDLLSELQAKSVKEEIIRAARQAESPRSWTIESLRLCISEGKPEWMPEDEFESINILISKFDSLLEEQQLLSKKEYELKQSEGEILSIKGGAENYRKRVQDQLEFINQLLSDPNSIERVEDYDTTFSKGNWMNLEKVASLLKSKGSASE